MAGIADTYTIDLVAQDADGTYLLVMVEDRPWGTHPDQSAQLQEKLNTYASYVLDGASPGSFLRRLPDRSGSGSTVRAPSRATWRTSPSTPYDSSRPTASTFMSTRRTEGRAARARSRCTVTGRRRLTQRTWLLTMWAGP